MLWQTMYVDHITIVNDSLFPYEYISCDTVSWYHVDSEEIQIALKQVWALLIPLSKYDTNKDLFGILLFKTDRFNVAF